MNMASDYFDLEKLENLERLSKEKVDDELDRLNDEVCRLTKGVAKIVLQPIIEEESRIFFNDDAQDENYRIVLTYTNTKTKSAVRNKFAALSYSEFYPVYVKPLKLENCELVKCNSPKELRKILKTMVNDDSVLRSMRLAIKCSEQKV